MTTFYDLKLYFVQNSPVFLLVFFFLSTSFLRVANSFSKFFFYSILFCSFCLFLSSDLSVLKGVELSAICACYSDVPEAACRHGVNVSRSAGQRASGQRVGVKQRRYRHRYLHTHPVFYLFAF